MWKPTTVERVLFRWPRWRRSIVMQWTHLLTNPLVPDATYLKTEARDEVFKLGMLSPSPVLEFYWMCCVTSDINIDYKATFKKIVVPPWLSSPSNPLVFAESYTLNPGARMYPPTVFTSVDIPYYLNSVEFPLHIENVTERCFRLFFKDDHEFAVMLKERKGRPIEAHKPGKPPVYSDRLAVASAVLKNSGSTYVAIAKQLNLPYSKPYESEQSDTVYHLVKRGAKLLSENLE